MPFVFNTLYNFEHEFEGKWIPRVDLYEDDISFYLIIELAGVDKKDLKIFIEDGRVVKIRGERKNVLKREKNTNHYKVEIRSGKFARDIELPQKIDANYIRLEKFNGIFKFILNKESPKKIKITKIE